MEVRPVHEPSDFSSSDRNVAKFDADTGMLESCPYHLPPTVRPFGFVERMPP